MPLRAIDAYGALGAEGDGVALCAQAQGVERRLQRRGACPGQGLRLVGEDQVHAVAHELAELRGKALEHSRVGKAHGHGDAGLPGNFPSAPRRGQARGGTDQIAFDVQKVRFGNRQRVQLFDAEPLGGAEIRVQAALGIWRYQHQTLARGLAGSRRRGVAHAGALQIAQVDFPIGVIRHPTAHETAPAEQGGGDQGVARAAATGVPGAGQMAFQRGQQLGATIAIHEGHPAFFHAKPREFGVLHADLRIDQRPAHAVYLVPFHRSARRRKSGALCGPCARAGSVDIRSARSSRGQGACARVALLNLSPT